MEPQSPKESADIPLEQLQQLDRICDRFEARWQGGQRPRVDEFLAEAPEAYRPQLLRLLVNLDLDYRRRLGEEPAAAVYAAEYPALDWGPLIELFADPLPGRRADPHPGPPAENPAPPDLEATRAQDPLAPKVGQIIASRFKLLEAIGEGGMGTVWMAEQSQPVRRKVALKLIKPGMDSKSVLARFETERQALAVMDHPNIAKVLDGGLTESDRPFFVMEYVKGVPITEYCEATRLSIPERLELFVQVCQAVQHAHQKGIIHRDLKPSNILVALYDSRPVPKVIDFGLAKAMHQPLTERTLHTAHETVVGTPLYMSPEQAQLNNLDIDTRADVYSLGVLLYELLTGTTPLEKKRFKEAAWEEIRRIIREEEPPRPSTRLSSSEILPLLAAGRRTEPVRLTKLVRGELDWIVMKSLEKDRTRRYETANGFAMDVQRYLADEPVEACPPSTSYRLKKILRRYKGPVLATALVLLVLLGGIAGTTWGLVEARSQRDHAEQEKQIAESVRDFLQNKLLGQADSETQADALLRAGAPSAEVKENPTIRELLDRAAKELAPEKIDANFTNEPLVQAEVLQTVGRTYNGVGESVRAIDFLQRSTALYRQNLGPDHSDTLTSMNNLAVAYQAAGKLELALPLFEETLRIQKANLGPDHPDTLISMNNLARAYQATGGLELALPLFEETLTLRKAHLPVDHPYTLMSMNNLASAYQAAGKLELALPLFEETVKRMKAKLGPDHPYTLMSMNNLARAYQATGTLELALPLFEETLTLRKAHLPVDHPYTLMSMNNLADAYRTGGKPELAVQLGEETVKRMKAKLGPDHPDTLMSMNTLALAYQSRAQVALRRAGWQDAAADLSKAVDLSAHKDFARFASSAVFLLAGDERSYRRGCHDLLKESVVKQDPNYAAEQTAKACLILPLKGDDLAKADRLAATAMRIDSQNKWNLLVQGIADCRTGRHAAAVELLNQAIERNASERHYALDAVAHLFLALAHQGQGHREEARKHLDSGRQLVLEVAHGNHKREFRENWWEWTTAFFVNAEAVRVVEGTPESTVRAQLNAEFQGSASVSATAPRKP